MARPERHDVDYFPFFAKRGKTLNILQSKYGLEGIGFFTNLMRFLALTPDHYYCIKDESDSLNFFAEIGMNDEKKGIAMIELMVKTGKLDEELWEKHKVIVCEVFLLSIKDAYERRANKIITIDEIRAIFKKNNNNPTDPPKNTNSSDNNPAVCELLHENSDNNPQTKKEETKLKKSKVNKTKEFSGSGEPPPKELINSKIKNSKQELTQEQLTLFHAAKACFELSEKAKAIMYQDKETTAREMRHLKTLVIRCTKIAPDITDEFLKNILEHFRILTSGKLKGKAVFTPRSLITPWIWELVIDSLPENESPELKEIARGLFK
jgi:hypothetical protein